MVGLSTGTAITVSRLGISRSATERDIFAMMDRCTIAGDKCADLCGDQRLIRLSSGVTLGMVSMVLTTAIINIAVKVSGLMIC